MKVVAEGCTTYYCGDNMTTLERGRRSWKVMEGKRKIEYTHRNIDPQRKSNEINPYLKDTLWSLPHACSENHSGVLKLCIGLPVMIKKNLATECCVTNGAEARVVG